MVVDSSALVAMITNEEDGEALSGVLDGPGSVRMSAASYLETSIVIDAHRDAALSAQLDDMILDSEIVIEPVTVEQARIARQAYRLVWVNPLKGHEGFAPLAGGMRIALRHSDEFVEGHNLVALEALADVISR